uniref:envelope stress response membrane protein PspB n=1 Tax=Thaumasiovibrio occultus TaxID=1891184 RepID=UPI000B357ABA|nr:envelope stress response membrane protein PspB [Thaumasiovibrio occultus]
MSGLGFLAVPLVIFMLIVAPLWLVLHYRSKRHMADGFQQADVEQIEELSKRAVAMRQRISALEKILDAESPGWRDKI